MKENFEKKQQVVFNPNHENANIHGMVGKDGEPTCFVDENAQTRCTACCHLLSIPELNKKELTQCIYQEPGKGCGLILAQDTESLGKRPKRCFDYHCSGDKKIVNDKSSDPFIRLDAYRRITLANEVAVLLEEISREEANKNLDYLPRL